MRFPTSSSSPSAAQLAPLLLALGHLVHAQNVTVTLDDGAYFGNNSDGVNTFLGIRFAEPPGRFEPPVPAAKHDGVLNATAFAPWCMQAIPAALAAGSPIVPGNQSEDCLFVNVYAPSTPAPAEGRTVMLWYFGGGFQYGSANTVDFDGSTLARNEDVIVVAPNYRTSAFGFPGAVEGIEVSKRNVGLYDQKLAADWVQRNIHNFGGDPAKVTIFGESAGGTSVDMLLLTSGLNPPFRAAITESGTSFLVTGPQAGGDLIGLVTGGANGTSNSTNPFGALAAAIGCPTSTEASLACVKAAPVDSVVKAIEDNLLNFPPVADGDVNVPTSPDATRAAGRVPKIPLLLGTNLKEAVAFTLGRPNTTMALFLEQTFPNNCTLQQQVAAAYPVGEGQPFDTTADAITQIATDLDFACATSHEARLSAAAGIPTWRYLFNSTSFPSDSLAEPVHGSEIAFVWGNLPAAPTTPDQALALSAFMQTAWANFAKNPTGGPGVAEWTPFTGVSGASDLGDLGGINGTGIVMVDPSVIDSRCYLYDAEYAKGLTPATAARRRVRWNL